MLFHQQYFIFQKYTCENGMCLCPIGYYGDTCENIITDCSHGFILGMSNLEQKISFVKPSLSTEPFEILCHFNWNGMAHILVRDTKCSTVNFNRTWEEYRDGFGDASGEHWIGLTKFHQMSMERSFRLNVFAIYSSSYQTAQGYYDTFSISDFSDGFKLQISSYFSHPTETCGDAWTASVNINNMPFSTYDNDLTAAGCPSTLQGGGWFSTTDPQCTLGNIFGKVVTWDAVVTQPIYLFYFRLLGR
ncbi:hypothetical protein SNE40_018787 [Patella caerulea]|uniref:Fibrinogen C-terminal domain-containing protein n=1 Tax=Patella caerulea TaxID=87958 RepID=A0AAN8J7K7_PATCE